MNQKKAGVILSYSSEAIKILTSLLYTPIMLRLLGQSEYGLYQLVNSVVSYLGLLSFGFTSSYIRFFSIAKAKGSEEETAKLNGMFMTVFLVISGIAAVCGSVMVGNIHGIFKTGLVDKEYQTAKILMILMIFTLCVSFPNSVLNCIISAHERFFFQRLLTVLQNLLNPFLTLPLLLMGYGSIGMVSISTAITIASFAVDVWYVFHKLHAKFTFHGFDFRLLKEMWTFTFFIFINQLIDQVNWSIDRFLLGRMVGTAAVAVYALGAQINILYVQLSTTISSVFAPQINRMVAQDTDDSQLSALFIRVGRIQFMLLSLVLSGFVFIGHPFMEKWGGIQYGDSYFVTLWLIAPVTVPLIQNLGIEIQRAKNKHQTRSIVYFCIALANIGISVPLIRLYGPVGAATGTAISLFCGNIVFMNWYYARHIGLRIGLFWKNIGTFIPALFVPLAFGALVRPFVQHTWLSLTGFAFAYACVYGASMFFLGMNTDEKMLFRSALKKLELK